MQSTQKYIRKSKKVIFGGVPPYPLKIFVRRILIARPSKVNKFLGAHYCAPDFILGAHLFNSQLSSGTQYWEGRNTLLQSSSNPPPHNKRPTLSLTHPASITLSSIFMVFFYCRRWFLTSASEAYRWPRAGAEELFLPACLLAAV